MLYKNCMIVNIPDLKSFEYLTFVWITVLLALET